MNHLQQQSCLAVLLITSRCLVFASAFSQKPLTFPTPLHVVLNAQCAEHIYHAPLDAAVGGSGGGDSADDTTTHPTQSGAEINLRYIECPGLVADGQEPTAILLYAGNEGDIWGYVNNTGFVFEMASILGAEVLFHEHRFYGKSMPIFPNPSSPNITDWYQLSFTERVEYYSAYLNFDATLNDFNYFIAGVRKRLGTSNGDENKIPVIVIGGSYGGTLAFWLRARFPEQFTGAIASSAPLLDFPGYIGHLQHCNNLFDRVVTQSFERESSRCRAVIAEMWSDFELLSHRYPSSKLNDIFRTCSDDDEDSASAADGNSNATVYARRRGPPIPNVNVAAATKISRYMRDAITYAAMINYPFAWNFLSKLPPRPVRVICDALLESFDPDADELLRLKSYANILQAYYNYSGDYDGKCFKNLDALKNASEQWNFQACTQFVSTFCNNGQTDFFPATSWDAAKFAETCRRDLGGVEKIPFDPFYNWREFGAFPELLRNVTNVIIVNGLNDPWSPFGISPVWLRRYAVSAGAQFSQHTQPFERPRDAVGVGPYDSVKVGVIPEQWLVAIQISNGAHHEDLVGNVAMGYSQQQQNNTEGDATNAPLFADDALSSPAVDSEPVLYARFLETAIVKQWIAATV